MEETTNTHKTINGVYGVLANRAFSMMNGSLNSLISLVKNGSTKMVKMTNFILSNTSSTKNKLVMKMQQLKYATVIKPKMAKITSCLKLHVNYELERNTLKSILTKFINLGNCTELSQGRGFFSLFANV